MPAKRKTLYLTRNGLLESLGQSQVLSYLRGLSQDYEITLVTFEKPHDLEDREEVARLQGVCNTHNIEWKPQIFRSRPRYFASLWGIIQLVWLVLWHTLAKGVCLVHARSYVPAAAALVGRRLQGTPFIFDMRALWPEELITAGRLRRNSQLHRAIVWLERQCLRRAATVVVLTHAAANYLRETYPEELREQKVEVIPTCANLDHFTPKSTGEEASSAVVWGCIGSVSSGWFLLDWLSAWYHQIALTDADAIFEIITRDDPDQVRRLVDPDGTLGSRLRVAARKYDEMPSVIRKHNCSFMVYAQGATSELGRSPTRMAEVLGCGKPVVANEGVGDVAKIIRAHRVGVILEGAAPEQIDAARAALSALEAEPDLAQRCRDTAQQLFSLPAGTAAYASIYQAILTGPR